MEKKAQIKIKACMRGREGPSRGKRTKKKQQKKITRRLYKMDRVSQWDLLKMKSWPAPETFHYRQGQVDWVGGGRGQGRDGGEEVGGAWLQSGVARQPSGVSVAGNISTLACMKERSGRPAITLAASSLRFSSFLGFLVEVLVFSMVDIKRAKASATRLPELPGSSLAVVSSYSSGSTPD